MGQRRLRFRQRPLRCGVEGQSRRSLDLHLEVPFGCTALARLPAYEKPEMELDAGSYDYHYQPSRDYRHLFTLDSRLEQLAACPEAVAILEEAFPQAADLFRQRDSDLLFTPIRNLLQSPFPGLDQKKLQETVDRILLL